MHQNAHNVNAQKSRTQSTAKRFNTKRKYAPPPPKRHVLDIGKHISLELTAAKYAFALNGGDK